MKKIFTLIAAVMIAASAMADNTFVFCDKDGNEIPNGSTVRVATADPSVLEEGMGMLESGVFVKNTASTSEVASLSFNITSLSEGSSLMVCLGTNCRNYEETGANSINNVTLEKNSINDLMTHWSAYTEDWVTYQPGSCTVDMTIQHAGNDCSTITINFVYGEDASLATSKSDVTVVSTFTMLGQKASANQKGIVLQQMSDGTVRKVIVK